MFPWHMLLYGPIHGFTTQHFERFHVVAVKQKAAGSNMNKGFEVFMLKKAESAAFIDGKRKALESGGHLDEVVELIPELVTPHLFDIVHFLPFQPGEVGCLGAAVYGKNFRRHTATDLDTFKAKLHNCHFGTGGFPWFRRAVARLVLGDPEHDPPEHVVEANLPDRLWHWSSVKISAHGTPTPGHCFARATISFHGRPVFDYVLVRPEPGVKTLDGLWIGRLACVLQFQRTGEERVSCCFVKWLHNIHTQSVPGGTLLQERTGVRDKAQDWQLVDCARIVGVPLMMQMSSPWAPDTWVWLHKMHYLWTS